MKVARYPAPHLLEDQEEPLSVPGDDGHLPRLPSQSPLNSAQMSPLPTLNRKVLVDVGRGAKN